MTREQIEELAALDALDALDGDDLAAWSAIREADASAAKLRDELAEAVTGLALLAPAVEAPEALRARVMGAVFGAEPQNSPSTTEAAAERTRGWSAWAAAAAIVALAVVGAAATTRQTESVVVRDERAEAGAPYVALTGYGDFSGSVASVLWDSGQRGWWLQAAGLPPLPPAYTYRVWAVGGDNGQVYDCGALLRHPDGLARRFLQPVGDISSMRGFAISIEPINATGSGPSSPAVLITPALRG